MTMPRPHDVELEITGDFDAQGLELLRLEMLELAKRYGVTIEEFRAEEPSRTSG